MRRGPDTQKSTKSIKTNFYYIFWGRDLSKQLDLVDGIKFGLEIDKNVFI